MNHETVHLGPIGALELRLFHFAELNLGEEGIVLFR